MSAASWPGVVNAAILPRAFPHRVGLINTRGELGRPQILQRVYADRQGGSQAVRVPGDSDLDPISVPATRGPMTRPAPGIVMVSPATTVL